MLVQSTVLLTTLPSFAAGKAEPCRYGNKDCECIECFGAAA